MNDRDRAIEHPQHGAMDRWGSPVRPIEPSGILLRWKLRRACRKVGGHWWHPLDAMIAWHCCQCGVIRDGWPKDGS